jgi:hypothetical protein
MDRFRDIPADILPFALYTHVSLSDEEVTRLIETCNRQLEPSVRDTVRLGPRNDFCDQPLRASFQHHINEVAHRREFYPFYFAALVTQDWENSAVLLVTLSDDNDECKVDKLFARLRMSGWPWSTCR